MMNSTALYCYIDYYGMRSIYAVPQLTLFANISGNILTKSAG